jgi:N,N-dimethylformamidase
MSDSVTHALRAGVVTGYAEPTWCTAGDDVAFKLAGPAGNMPLSVVRLRHGDPDPCGPGLLTEPVQWGQVGEVSVVPRDLALGSYAIVPDLQSLPDAGGTVAIRLCPTMHRGGWHAIVARVPAADGVGFGLFIGGDGILAACAIESDGHATWVSSPEAVHLDEWQAVVVTVDLVAGELRLTHRLARTGTFSRTVELEPGPRAGTLSPLLFGAAPDPSETSGVRHHFNGVLAQPVLLGAPLAAEAVADLLAGAEPGSLAPVLGDWCFGLAVTTDRLVDRSASAAHGVVVNAPARAVPGPQWRRFPSDRYVDRPEVFDGVHLHDDDIDDAGWPTSASLTVPSDVAPGIYAARVDNAEQALWLPFVVARAAPAAGALVLVPTLSWQAYSSNRQPFTWTEDGSIDLSVGTYDLHSDGSPVYYTSARRPHRAGVPDRGFRAYGAHNLTANLYLVDWLDALGFEYDVASDHHLHGAGVELLSRHRCVVLGSHPEYWSAQMLEALIAYQAEGGRVMYLGGNGLYWVTSIDPVRPWLIEVRKRGEGDFAGRIGVRDGESVHSTTLENGGTWASRGIPPRDVVGVEFAANAHPHTTPGPIAFYRTDAARDDRYRFVFDGVPPGEGIGGFGSGVAGAGYEMDAVWPEPLPGMSSAVLLARAHHETFYGPRRVPLIPAADIALRALPRGGAVFSAGSVTWTALLSHAGYRNNVSRVTENVLRRFIESPRGASVLDESVSTPPAM